MGEVIVPIKVQISDFMKLLYVKGEKAGWAEGFHLREIADELKIPMGLVVKISKYLEQSNLLEYESGTVDLTVEGITRVQEATMVPKTDTAVTPATSKNGTQSKAGSKK